MFPVDASRVTPEANTGAPASCSHRAGPGAASVRAVVRVADLGRNPTTVGHLMPLSPGPVTNFRRARP